MTHKVENGPEEMVSAAAYRHVEDVKDHLWVELREREQELAAARAGVRNETLSVFGEIRRLEADADLKEGVGQDRYNLMLERARGRMDACQLVWPRVFPEIGIHRYLESVLATELEVDAKLGHKPRHPDANLPVSIQVISTLSGFIPRT